MSVIYCLLSSTLWSSRSAHTHTHTHISLIHHTAAVATGYETSYPTQNMIMYIQWSVL